MELRTSLSGHISKHWVKEIAKQVDTRPHCFDELYRLLYEEERKVSWRAAWVCANLCEEYPDRFMDKREELMQLAITSSNPGLIREILSILHLLPVSQPVSVAFLNWCLDRITVPGHPIAIQVLSIKLLYAIACVEKELLPEIILCLESIDPEYASPAIRSVLRNIFKKIKRKK